MNKLGQIGTLVAVAVTIIGMGMWQGSLAKQVDTNSLTIGRHEQYIDRLITIEANQQRMLEDFKEMKQDIKSIAKERR